MKRSGWAILAIAAGLAASGTALASEQCDGIHGKGNGATNKLAKEAAHADMVLRTPVGKKMKATYTNERYSCHEVSPANHRCTIKARVCWK